MEDAIIDITKLHGKTGMGRALLNIDKDYRIDYWGYSLRMKEDIISLKEGKDDKKYLEETLNNIKDNTRDLMSIGKIAYDRMVKEVIIPVSGLYPYRNKKWQFSMENQYTRPFASINFQSSFALHSPDDSQELLSIMDGDCRAIDSAHARLGLGEVPFNEDTQYFFACIKLYSELKKTFDSLEKQLYILESLKDTAQKLKDGSKEIVDTPRPKYLEMHGILNELRAIPGCDDRLMRKRKPKNN